MGRIVFTVILLVLLTILIVMNLGPTAPVNLFGARFEKVPIIAIALLSFALGVVFSLILYVGQSLHRASRQRLEKRHKDLDERERKLAEAQGPEQGQEPAGQPEAQDTETPKKQSGLSKFFRKFM